jgi:tripartite-type tricarboxylate transporter receptor subunit TctC
MRHSPFLLGFTVLAASAVVAGCSSSGTGSTTSGHAAQAAADSAPDLAFYKGKTVTWDVPTPPGSAFYSTAVVLAPKLGTYLHATVNIVSIPAGATIAGQDQAAAAPADGLTVGDLNLSVDVTDLATKQPTVNFNIKSPQYLAGLPINPEVIVSHPGSPYQSWSALVSADSTLKSTDYPGSAELLEKSMYGAYDIKASLISGYSTVPDLVAGFLRGDTDLAVQQVTGLVPAIIAGKAKPLLLTSPIPAGTTGYDQLKSVPSIASYYATNPPKTQAGRNAVQAAESLFGESAPNQVFFLPAGTPAGRVTAMAAAFKYALGAPGVRAAFLKATLMPGYFTPAQVEKAVDADIKFEPTIASATTSYQG